MQYLYKYMVSPEIPVDATKYNIIERTNDNKLVMSFLEADYSINAFLHSLPNVAEAAGALQAIRAAEIIWVGTDPEPPTAMYDGVTPIVYISCDNVTPYAATDGRIYTVWYGLDMESSDTRFWDRDTRTDDLLDITPQVFNPTPDVLLVRYYNGGDVVLDPSRMGVIVNDDITLSFTYKDMLLDRKTYNTAQLTVDIRDALLANMTTGKIVPTYTELLNMLNPATTSADANAIYVVSDASGDADIDSGAAVYFYDHVASQTGAVVVTRIHDDTLLDIPLTLASVDGGPLINGTPVTNTELDLLVEYSHTHTVTPAVLNALSIVNGDLVVNGVTLNDGVFLDGDGADTW